MCQWARAVTLLLLIASGACGSASTGTTGPGGTGGTGGARADSGACGSGPADPDAALGDAFSSDGSADPDGGTADPDAPPPGGECHVEVESHPIEGAQHMPLCSPLTFGSNPPSSGNHYAIWADYLAYERSIARGFWVHSLEHGAVVITYHCPGGCPDEVAAVRAFIDALPADCGPMSRRVILTPDPDLDVRFAASAWGWTLRASCFDRDAFQTFFNEHYDHAPESICGGGTDPTDLCGPSLCP